MARGVATRPWRLFARGREIAARRGLILVDTKYEFGFDETGAIVLADEIHTPDSSRYWLAGSYPARFAGRRARPRRFDKDFVRRWVAARCDPYSDPIPDDSARDHPRGRGDLYRRLREDHRAGVRPAGPGVPPLARVRANLSKYFERAA